MLGQIETVVPFVAVEMGGTMTGGIDDLVVAAAMTAATDGAAVRAGMARLPDFFS